jgi:hypothetical protein
MALTESIYNKPNSKQRLIGCTPAFEIVFFCEYFLASCLGLVSGR